MIKLEYSLLSSEIPDYFLYLTGYEYKIKESSSFPLINIFNTQKSQIIIKIEDVIDGNTHLYTRPRNTKGDKNELQNLYKGRL